MIQQYSDVTALL